ncbi:MULTISPECIES: 16S rRNA (guanine(966)-N(2))-methyltransferase RsmD [Methylosinus]|uniref:16S rRNA (Guanine(966)-N(2))-methyltransferase RsmD n=1 Tax=Methylosinus trichosporium (strain ATCC 35070 / NCIMB 11131 / UNIQEM 75 / OB3b) TaxID=595536 RepID=A0A2D2CZD3_METT3|nr:MULTISPECIES: 16S rRNA (guanine(966)-N(2))-methyltransferase RsmD [Methylosinus]ATQ68076.1 16S rRNA (guanine(966)-N(2))-methyltransferase RsmD [Methylosinus trichosporium OB3b]OBS54361.1 16S rRNA (guanine(966)-N(2))-methyltransferase RsmD [Methylosinus sp. 3S-1]
MRIVAGALRGRNLKAPQSRDIRPTSDRLRESIFDILAHAYGDPVAGARVIDLFAGVGALGLEALSRGAERALFVDDGVEARALLRANIDALGLGGVTRVFRRDATKLGLAPPGERFSLAFLDPPYGRGLAPRALASLLEGGWLAEESLIVIEEAAEEPVPLPEGVAEAERRRYGDTQIVIARRA